MNAYSGPTAEDDWELDPEMKGEKRQETRHALTPSKKKTLPGRRNPRPGLPPAPHEPQAGRDPGPDIDVGVRGPGQAVPASARRRQGEFFFPL